MATSRTKRAAAKQAPQTDALVKAIEALVNSNPDLKAALAQYATPAAVVEQVITPPTPRDVAYATVKDAGYGFAANGEVVVLADALTAAARVLRTGTPGTVEVVPAPTTDANTRRKITGTAVYKVDDRTIAFHAVYALADKTNA